jgi:hypothetical protein
VCTTLARHLHHLESLDDLPDHLALLVRGTIQRDQRLLKDENIKVWLSAAVDAGTARRLNLRWASALTDEALKTLASFPSWAAALVRLDLGFCEGIGDDGIRALAPAMRGIKSLVLTGCTRCGDGSMLAIGQAMQAIVILAIVGMLIGAWIQAGVVPALIVWGLDLISPAVFLVTACLVCCVVSLASGSSWTTAGTVGVALMGDGTTMGISPGMVAGAIVSGSYFGDKMSPLSDTTNLAPAMAGATLMEHIRHMIWTVTPALLLALGAYAVLGLDAHAQDAESMSRVVGVTQALRESFTITPWLLLPPLLVLALVILKKPAIPALFFGTINGLITAHLLKR